MQLEQINSPKKIFKVVPSKFEIISPDNSIDYDTLTEETERLMSSLSNIPVDDAGEAAFADTLEFLLSFDSACEACREWASNLLLEDYNTFKNYEKVYNILNSVEYEFKNIVSLLEDYLSLKDYILKYRAFYFEHVAFSKDGFALKRNSIVYFYDHDSRVVRSGVVYCNYEDYIILHSRDEDGALEVSVLFEEVYFEKANIKDILGCVENE